MDFHQLMNLAASKQETGVKKKIGWYSRDLPAPKREEKPKPKSEVVQKLIEEKERERQAKKEAEQAEQERLEKEERKKNQFRIPKKKPEPVPVDTETFINSLFDDSGVLSDNSEKSEPRDDSETRKSHSPSPSSSSKKHRSEHSSSHDSKRDKNRDSSEKRSSSSSHHHKSSSEMKPSTSSSSKHSEHKSSSSSSKDNGKSSSSHSSKNHHSSSKNHRSSSREHHSSSHKSSSSSDRQKDKSSSNSDKHKSASTNSDSKSSSKGSGSSSQERHSSHSSKSQSSKLEEKSTSTSKSSSSTSKSPKDFQNSSGKSASSPSSSAPQRTASDEQPIVLNKHHLHPIIERHAAPVEMTEREKILARLQAIKQRTLDAIKSSSKSKQPKGEKSHRKSKGEEKHDDKMKSVEIVREIPSSDDDEPASNMPSALDIMLSEHSARTEKGKIARMAKQAWERALKKGKEDSDKEAKVKKKVRSSHREKDKHHKTHRSHNKNNHQRRDHSLSPDQDIRKSSPKPKKPTIVRRHANNVPPPMDFKSILAMAEQKQKEPLKPMVPIPKPKKKEEEQRPMTQEEKDRVERKKTKEYQDWLKFGGKPPPKQKNSDEDDDDDDDSDERHKPMASNHMDKKQFSQPSSSADRGKTSSGSSKHSLSKHALEQQVSKPQASSSMTNGKVSTKQKNITMNENVLVCGPATSSGDEASPRRAQGSSQNPFDRIMNQVHKKRPGPRSSDSGPLSKKKRFLDSEDEEEESDLDGFIDDGDDGEADYSKEIEKLFGYNRNKFKYENEDDLSDMEADFSTIMREEKRSAKLGLMEDLEDMKREEEELRKKALLKKKMKRS